jgi:outer membrane pore protein F
MMKRNILAVVIPALLVAGAANAAEIYNKDGNKLDLYGKVDARHNFSDNAGDDGDQTYVRFGFKGETQITDQLTGYGQWEYNVQANHAESAGDEGNKTRLGFAGLKFGDAGSFDYGRNYGVIYDVMSYTDQLPIFGDDTMYQNNDNFMVGRGNGMATYRNSNFFGLVDGLSFAVQYQGKNDEGRDGRGAVDSNGDGWGTSAAYALGNSGVSLTGAYFSSNRTSTQKLTVTATKLTHTHSARNTTLTTCTWQPSTVNHVTPPITATQMRLLTKLRTSKWLHSTSSTSVCVHPSLTCSLKASS